MSKKPAKRTRRTVTRAQVPRDNYFQGFKTQGSSFPRRKHVQMRFCDNYALSTTASSGNAVFSWRANCINQPAYTSAKHRPIGYNEWQSVYQRITVYAVSYRITAFNTQDNNGSYLFGLWPTTSSDSYNPASYELERMQEKRGFTTYTCDYGKTKVIKGKIFCHKIAGITKAKLMAEDDYSENFNPSLPLHSPTNTLYLSLIWNRPGGVASKQENFNVQLTYHCVLSDPKTVLKSELPT